MPSAFDLHDVTHRREALRRLFWSAGALACSSAWAAPQAGGSGTAASGPRTTPAAALPVEDPRLNPWAGHLPLRQPDALGLCLPEGLQARIVAVSGEAPAQPRSAYRWHRAPDGGATFALPDGGWVYVSNSEMPEGGGVGALRFDAQARVVDAYPILSGTRVNCAGGRTPWDTWLSCEEHETGQVFECWPTGHASDARARPALGLFQHEAAAIDPVARAVYLTEDEPQGRFYRFLCSPSDWPAGRARPALESGRLQVLQFADLPPGAYPPSGFDVMVPRPVRWVDVASPQEPQRRVRQALGREAPGSVFKGGEGLWYHAGIAYFSTKGDDRIWAYDPAAQSLQAIYDFRRMDEAGRVLSGVDNLTVSSSGLVLVAEDGGNMELCVIGPDRRPRVLLQVTGQDGSELTGPAFSPDGSRLYFSSQRGGRRGMGTGITYEVRRVTA